MAARPFTKEELNFLKFASIVHDEFPKMLRHTFETMWNNKIAPTLPGVQVWDDSPAVRNVFQTREGAKTKIPTNKSFKEWDCAALFKATIYSKTFGVTTSTATKTLSQQYLQGKKPNPFHSSVVSPTGNQDEGLALAIDQLRLLRNKLCHISWASVSKPDFDQFVLLAKDAFTATGFTGDRIDDIGNLREEDFPTEKVNELNEKVKVDLQEYSKFLQDEVIQQLSDHKQILQRLDKNDQDSKLGPMAKGFAMGALFTRLIYSKGGELFFNIITESVWMVRDVGITAAVTLGVVYAAYKIIDPRVFLGAVTEGLGGERNDQEIRDIEQGSLRILLRCLTDERYLEVLEDFESGRMRDRLQKEFLEIGIEVKGMKIEIINIEEVNETKEAIDKRYDNHVSNCQRAFLNFKRAVSNVNKREKMFAVSAWTQIAVSL